MGFAALYPSYVRAPNRKIGRAHDRHHRL